MATVRIDGSLARQRTADLMVQAQREIPLFHVTKHAVAEALHLRSRADGVSMTAALLPLVATWLTSHPLLNGHWVDELRPASQVDLGVAWSHRENVLVVPTLRDCAGWSVAEFADALAALRERSRDDAFRTADFGAPTFTVSNLGASGIDHFTSLVTPPQVAVLSVAAVARRPVVGEWGVDVAHTLPLTLGIDHRAIDGAYAASALAALVRDIEGVQA
jgi:pyruvate dehydrogenase E2 component (dihydrolipoyllysine-residue acetyltransferase)